MKKKLLFVTVILFALVLVGCGKKEEKPTLIGEWDYSGFVFKFNEDKTGSYTAGDSEMTFTYEDKGDEVSILFDGNTAASIYKYRVEKDKLYFTDSFGKEIIYTKK
ncbi:MAG: hypothetical protein II625_04620 [Bacilli bacterium]|nr:hypothetical protein [Bacilli bacterium]